MLSEAFKSQGKKLLALQRNNSAQNYPTETRQLIFKSLRLIETFFSQATDQLIFEQVNSKSLRGLFTRLLFKFLASYKFFYQYQIFDFLTLTMS